MQKSSKKKEEEKVCLSVILKEAHRFKKEDAEIFQREIILVYWLAENLNQRQAGAKAGMGYDLTRAVISKLYSKTGCSTHAGLVSYFRDHGLLYRKNNRLTYKIIDKRQRERKAA